MNTNCKSDMAALAAMKQTQEIADRLRETMCGLTHRIENGDIKAWNIRSGVLNAAVKRASLDLTRKLAELRRVL